MKNTKSYKEQKIELGMALFYIALVIMIICCLPAICEIVVAIVVNVAQTVAVVICLIAVLSILDAVIAAAINWKSTNQKEKIWKFS